MPKLYYSLREAVEEIGKHLFPDEWTGEEGEALRLPPTEEAGELLTQRRRLKIVAREIGLRDCMPYDFIAPTRLLSVDDYIYEYGMRPEPAYRSPPTPLARLRFKLRETDRIDQWPEVASSEYEEMRAAYLRWVEAEAELVEALREGFLLAVIQEWDGRRNGLSPEQWRHPGTRYFTRSSKFEIRSYYKAPPQLLHCEIPVDWLRKLLSLGEVAAAGPGVDPYHTGVGGHRTAIHFVQEEHERRIRAGEVCSRLGDEAGYLADWSRREHPKAPPLSAGRIENAIRERHNRYKSGGDPS